MTRLTKRAMWVAGALAFAAGTRELDAQTERWGYLREMFPQAIDYPANGAAGDVDGDGDLDLYMAAIGQGFPSFYSPQDRLFLNDGRGRFTDATSRLPVDGDETHAVALGDIDNDGDLDAVLAIEGSPCRIYLNVGQGNFQDAPALLPPQPSPGPVFFCVSLADFDIDGDLDAFFTGETNRLWLNQGPAGFVDATAANLPPAPVVPVWTRDVAVGDIDGDGDSDLVLGNLGSPGSPAQNEIYLNVGNASFLDVTATYLPQIVRPTMAVDLGDVDGDGDPDLYVANIQNGGQPSEAQDELFLNLGTGRFVEVPSLLPVETYYSNDADFADLDRDGDLDVLVANGIPNNLPSEPDQVLLNDGTGAFSPSATGFTGSAIKLSTHRWVTGDYDADGDTDCVALAAVETRVFLNRGNAELVDVTNRYPWMISGRLAAGDFDRDGIVDLAALSLGISGVRQCRLLRGRGNGEFVDVSTRMPYDVPLAADVAAGDLDRDGDDDLVFGASMGTSQLYFMRNDGAGNFATASILNVPEEISDLVLGDLNGDGLLDVAVGSTGQSGQNRIIMNRGAWSFLELAGAIPVHLGYTLAVALGDLDIDGDLDLFVAKGGFGGALAFENRVYLNAGNGRFATASGALPAHVEPSTSVSLGDVDGDGDLDALVGNGGSSANLTNLPVNNRLYLNNGNAVFADASTSLPALPPDTTRDVALFDCDADGDLDAYIGNQREPHRLYRNNGAGRFSDASFELPATRALGFGVTVVDVDRDGDPDICSGNLGGLVLFNLQRQIARRTPSSLGKSFAMDLRGNAGAPWILLASPGTAAIGLPPFGTLYLDPANLAVVVTGSFDAQGRASVDFRVPRWRGFLGQAVYWQAAMNFSPTLSNFEITTVTDY